MSKLFFTRPLYYPLVPGTHSMTGVVLGYAESDMIEFEIIAE